MANYNVLGNDWTNIVFQGRNKEYGAYKLRKDNQKNMLMALGLGMLVLAAAFTGAFIKDKISTKNAADAAANEEELLMKEVVLPEPIPEPVVEEIKKEEPKPVVEEKKHNASKSVQDEVKYTETKVVEDNKVKNEQKTTQDKFTDDNTSGRDTRKGDKDGDTKFDGKSTGGNDKGSDGKGKGDEKTKSGGDDGGNRVFTVVSNKAVMPGGWQERFMKEFRSPDLGSGVDKISLRISFVVEKDGSLTDIKVANDQYGLAGEVARVLKKLPKWTPAQHNGTTVRSKFTQPITIRVN